MRASLVALGDRLRPMAPLALRLALAAILCAYGGRLVLRELPTFTTAVLSWSLPKWVAPVAAWTALVGGGLIGIGLLTRVAAFGCAGFTVLILVKTKLHAGWQGGLDLPVLVIAGCVSLLLSGAGRFSVDRRLFGGA